MDKPMFDLLTCFDALVATARAEHELRARTAQRAGEAAARDSRSRTARTPLRRRAGDALVALGHRIGGPTPAPVAGHLHQDPG